MKIKCSKCEHLYYAKEFGVYSCSEEVRRTGFTAVLHIDYINGEPPDWCPLKEKANADNLVKQTNNKL